MHWKHVVLLFGIVIQYLQRRLFSAMSSEAAGKGSGKRWHPWKALSITAQFQEKVPVCFPYWLLLPSLKSAKDSCHGRRSCFVTFSIPGFNVGEWIPKHEYKTVEGQDQGHTWTWGFFGSCFGRNLKYNCKEEHKIVFSCLCYKSIVLTFFSDGFMGSQAWLAPKCIWWLPYPSP